jgi:hypothetical protein
VIFSICLFHSQLTIDPALNSFTLPSDLSNDVSTSKLLCSLISHAMPCTLLKILPDLSALLFDSRPQSFLTFNQLMIELNLINTAPQKHSYTYIINPHICSLFSIAREASEYNKPAQLCSATPQK